VHDLLLGRPCRARKVAAIGHAAAQDGARRPARAAALPFSRVLVLLVSLRQMSLEVEELVLRLRLLRCLLRLLSLAVRRRLLLLWLRRGGSASGWRGRRRRRDGAARGPESDDVRRLPMHPIHDRRSRRRRSGARMGKRGCWWRGELLVVHGSSALGWRWPPLPLRVGVASCRRRHCQRTTDGVETLFKHTKKFDRNR
jgi:hypothetical protein